MFLFLKCLPRLFSQANKDLKRHFVLTFSSSLSIAIALLMAMVMTVLAVNVSYFTENIEEQLVIQVSINPTFQNDEIEKLQDELQTIKNVKTIEYSDSEEELDKLIKDYGETFAQYQGEDKNPLYDVFLVELKDNAKIEETTSVIQKLDGVMEATYGTSTVNTMVQMFSGLRIGGMIFVAALIFLAIFLIRNTVKLAIQVRKDEISIMKSVGATNWYILFPFVLEGMLTGFFGALLPSLFCVLGYTSLYNALNGTLMSDMFTLIKPYPFTIYVVLMLLGIGILVGMLGSYLATRKYLRWTR